MIKLHGNKDNSPEYLVAEQIVRIALDAMPNLRMTGKRF